MQYPNNDLWSVRQIEFLEDALDGYGSKPAVYYPDKTTQLSIPDIATYNYVGVLHFPDRGRTIIFEQGQGYGLSKQEILAHCKHKNIPVEIR
jgi:hypothetical protein